MTEHPTPQDVEMKLAPVQRAFLECLRDGRRLPHATRWEDRARQAMRRAGYAVVLKNPRRWALTELGRRALETREPRT